VWYFADGFGKKLQAESDGARQHGDKALQRDRCYNTGLETQVHLCWTETPPTISREKGHDQAEVAELWVN